MEVTVANQPGQEQYCTIEQQALIRLLFVPWLFSYLLSLILRSCGVWRFNSMNLLFVVCWTSCWNQGRVNASAELMAEDPHRPEASVPILRVLELWYVFFYFLIAGSCVLSTIYPVWISNCQTDLSFPSPKEDTAKKDNCKDTNKDEDHSMIIRDVRVDLFLLVVMRELSRCQGVKVSMCL